MTETATQREGVDLDSVSAHWRLVFDAAQDTLAAVSACGGRVELDTHQRAGRLTAERREVAGILDELALDEHVAIRHRLSAPRATPRMLGLPHGVHVCVFDLDGVLTASATLHAAAWSDALDELLARRLERTGERFAPFMPFNRVTDYYGHIHGRPRLDGVRAFLASRGIRLPEGGPDDPPGAETVSGLASRKNEALQRRLEHDGVTAFDGSRRYLEDAREARLRCAVVSASANTAAILERAGLDGLIGERIDGNTIGAERLKTKPAPDTLLAACARLGVGPAEAASFETTVDGVTAGRAAGFGLVVGVDRAGGGDALGESGADLVVTDLAALLDPVLAA
jgi:beta-phosphoglucomutase-like phosphatase (HAD superfamily)